MSPRPSARPVPDLPDDAAAPRGTRRQNGERTRTKILVAARREFAARGYAGARIDDIARRAGVNKSLIFYYFKSKLGLSRAGAEKRLARYALPRADATGLREDPFQWPLWLFQLGEDTQDAVRYALWEGVDADSPHPTVTDAEMRRKSFQEQVDWVRQHQAAGTLPDDLDAAQLTFFLYILGVVPYVLPQFAYMIMGGGPNDPRFRAQFEQFIQGLAQSIGTAPHATQRPARSEGGAERGS